MGRALSAHAAYSRGDDPTDCGENDLPPMPWWCELLPAKQLTFQTHFLNFVKPFISDRFIWAMFLLFIIHIS